MNFWKYHVLNFCILTRKLSIGITNLFYVRKWNVQYDPFNNRHIFIEHWICAKFDFFKSFLKIHVRVKNQSKRKSAIIFFLKLNYHDLAPWKSKIWGKYVVYHFGGNLQEKNHCQKLWSVFWQREQSCKNFRSTPKTYT